MDRDTLNEIGTLLHIWESIAQNHPNLQGIGRQCLRRLNELEADAREWEAEEAEKAKQREAEQQQAEYVETDEEPELDENGNPTNQTLKTNPVPVERRV